MTHAKASRIPSARTDRDVLVEVFRRLGAVHASLAEAATPSEDLHQWTLDNLMDVLDYIDEALPAEGAR